MNASSTEAPPENTLSYNRIDLRLANQLISSLTPGSSKMDIGQSIEMHDPTFNSSMDLDVENLSSKSGTTDLALAVECLHKVISVSDTLQKIHTILRAGGALIATFPTVRRASDDDSKRIFTHQQALEALANGFQVLQACTIPFIDGEPHDTVLILAVKTPVEGAALAISHALKHKFLKILFPRLLTVGGIELTNLCNLKCKQCPTPTTRAVTGYASDETVLSTLDLTAPGSLFSYHRLGEPLLHPKLILYVKWAADRGIKPQLSTNGILLTAQLLGDLIDAGLRNLQITFHTIASVRAYAIAVRYLLANPEVQLELQGNHLPHYDKVPRWLDECGITSSERRFILEIPSHNWAGNVPGTRKIYSIQTIEKRMKSCYYIQNNRASVRWDGTVVACCFDSENDNVIGHINHFTTLSHQPSNYRLCSSCDPNWANGFVE